MKQNVLISIYQVVATALCTYLVFKCVGADLSFTSASLYISLAMLALNIVVILLFWKHFARATRFRLSEAIMLMASAFVPMVENYTFIGDNTAMPTATAKLVLLFALGQASWCLAVYLAPDLVGKIRERKKSKLSNNLIQQL